MDSVRGTMGMVGVLPGRRTGLVYQCVWDMLLVQILEKLGLLKKPSLKNLTRTIIVTFSV